MARLAELKKYIKNNKNRAIKHLNATFDIAKFSDEDIFYMLVFCILVPAGKATKAAEALEELKKLDYYNVPLTYEEVFTTIKSLARFPKQKTERLVHLHNHKYKTLEIIRNYLKAGIPKLLRDVLVKEIKGVGYKAASHFLRNLGVKDLAILDIHVLKYLEYFAPKLKIKGIPSHKKQYELVEKQFNLWAKKEFKLKPAELDWLIWCFESNNDIEELKS